MRPSSLSICSQCRHKVFATQREQWINTAGLALFKRYRGSSSSTKKRSRWDNAAPYRPHQSSEKDDPWPIPPHIHHEAHHHEFRPRPSKSDFNRPWKERVWDKPLATRKLSRADPKIDPNNIPAFVESDVTRWSAHRALPARLASFGIPPAEIPLLLGAFVSAVKGGEISTPSGFTLYGLSRFAQDLKQGSDILTNIDTIFSTILFTWASQPSTQPLLESLISPNTVHVILSLASAGERSFPAEGYPPARQMHRKVIMHVGPTNSGKTHNALRALAASSAGVYAGPLRLLAHEIWERLNLGQIVPLGMEEGEAAEEDMDEDSALDVAGAVKKKMDKRYARACNMVTGEEQKIVRDDAPLMSCTVEMLALMRPYDVAVVDEIQMIADEMRGFAWTQALLGLCAKELHLCGEETAVPLVRELLKETGDELIVNRYQRLTPLEVEEESLDGDFSKVRKGDCIVTFSRSSIFGIKRRIETLTGMRCAVVYGKLPPEIRSEQAALFNDPNSGYDVIIGSDAIGMGLNLKIRRVVFEAVRKWNGTREEALSVSQTKQIAGRAGRYGLHGSDNSGGSTTTLLPSDLAFLRKTLPTPLPALQYARIGPSEKTFRAFANALPASSSTQTIFDAHRYISRLPPTYRYVQPNEETMRDICAFIDMRGKGLTFADRVMLVQAPIPWRDDKALEIVGRFISMYRDEMDVELTAAMEGTQMLETLGKVEVQMMGVDKVKAAATMLEVLESLHRVLVVYLWMSFRYPVVYHCHDQVADMKGRVERALEWVLKGMTMGRREKKMTGVFSFEENMRRKPRAVEYLDSREAKKRRIASGMNR
ncbi:ATP-dependent RNA helicase suv3, mitochondrial [Hypsizygus marmoreus]|uniref:RNA helicase n=1 Tax=Hypsizygus marmoreus TaxID=39966 RepID=A0A369JFD8_HYPMA|nr:ATP-dependent RNA helicase suv3, mitochondrial [Hypsizygus marmoreus]